uniref:PP1-binding domain-containing protein n=1 Tax=Myripristis murdjan TaxID=586833 RepID=A0A668ARS0_9TELE
MTSPELNAAGIEGDEEVRKLSSSEEEHVSLLGDTSAPLNFSQLSPSRFGISTQSFIPSSANHKDKSRLAQLKARRRSNIGVRGSPETNSLIRYMAQQRIKTPPTYQTPEPFKNSPFLPRVASTLRQKMASFQSLMDVEESEVCGPAPRQDSETGGCVETRDYLSAEGASGHISGFSVSVSAGVVSSSGASTLKKKKQVRFGGPLSPEFFDKNLPPSTPLQKGSTPARAPTPGEGFQLRSVLKTPQMSEPCPSLAQLNLSSPSVFGASPTLAMPRSGRKQAVGEDARIACACVRAREREKERVKGVGGGGCMCVDIIYPDASSLFPQQPEDSKPVKRSTRSAAKSASGKMKTSSVKRRWGNKEVDRSLYGSREYASKNPNLSPITETLSSTSRSPTPQEPRSRRCTGKPHLRPFWYHVGISETVSFSDKNLANQRKSAPRNAEADMGARCRSRGRRSSGYHSVPPESKEQTSQAAEHHTDHKAEEKKLRDQAASQLEANHQSSSALAPWQAEFNLEDVFKPVATRGQRSVRRSLRNQSNVDHSSGDSGLAWLPRTSPDSSTQARRRTRGQKLSGTAPLVSNLKPVSLQ